MKPIMKALILCLVMALTGCGAVLFEKCRPSGEIDLTNSACEFDRFHPTACIGQLWVRVKCPTE